MTLACMRCMLYIYELYGLEVDMTTQMAIRIDDETKERFTRISRQEGKSASEKMRELIDAYVRKADLSLVVDDIWERIGEKIRRNGITEDDVDRAVQEARASK